MILLGKLIAETKLFGQEILEQTMRKVVSERKQDLIAHNLRALALGAEQ
jgi:hypothetical protein